MLLKETNALASSLKILQEEISDPESSLRQAGEDRVHTVNEMVKSIEVTVKKLETLIKKYEHLKLNPTSRRRQIWSTVKWSLDFTSIEGLRSKVSWW